MPQYQVASIPVLLHVQLTAALRHQLGAQGELCNKLLPLAGDLKVVQWCPEHLQQTLSRVEREGGGHGLAELAQELPGRVAHAEHVTSGGLQASDVGTPAAGWGRELWWPRPLATPSRL